MKSKRSFAAAFMAAILFLSCASLMFISGTKPEPQQKEIERGTGYVDRSVRYYKKSLEENNSITCRFYDDMPDVPYVEIRDFYSSFYNGKMSLLDPVKNGLFSFSEENSRSGATIDLEKDVLFSENLSLFCNNPKFSVRNSSGITVIATSPFLKLLTAESDFNGKETTIDFSRWGIDIRSDGEKLFMPLATLSDMFAVPEGLVPCPDGQIVIYNGEKIYYGDSAAFTDTDFARDSDPSILPILTEERSRDLADFTYRELCFNVDNFYGFPLNDNAFSDKIKSDGLDAALDAFYPEIKKAILSQNSSDYIAGLDILFSDCLCDCGHTQFPGGDVLTSTVGKGLYFSAISAKKDQLRPKELPNVSKSSENRAARKKCSEQRNSFFSSPVYNTYGDTAVFTFSSFYVNYDAWQDYYHGRGAFPDEADVVSSLYKYLKIADEDPAVKNFILDMTSNGGGDLEAVNAIFTMLSDGTVRCSDSITGQVLSYRYLMDRNFDRNFDETDSKPLFSDLHFAVLTSRGSFSAANALTAYCKDNGIMVIGEKTGGGACGISFKSTADGLEYMMSSYLVLADRNTDNGIEPDVVLPVNNTDGEKDYSEFYNIERLSMEMNSYYSGANSQ